MEFLRDLSPWTVFGLLGLISLLVLLIPVPADKRHVRWNRLIQLVFFDLVVLYVYFSLRNAALDRMPREAQSWAILFVLILIALPFAMYWGWLRLASVFLLPVELARWRDWWRFPGRAITTFAQGRNYPYYSYDEKTEDLVRSVSGSIMPKNRAGIIAMRPEHAVVLHTGPRLSRVVGGDIVFTRKIEQVLQLVDLRDHLIVVRDAPAVTKDGLTVKFHIFIICRIDRTGAPEQPEHLYPFNPDTVRQVVSQQQGLGEKGKQAWYDLVAQRAQKAACDVIANYVLDRLYVAEDADQIPRNEVRERIQERLKAEMTRTGIHIVGLGIANIEPVELPAEAETTEVEEQAAATRQTPISVSKQRVTSWQVSRQARDREREARGEAEAIRIVEQARAQALTELIKTAAEGFREMSASGAAHPSDVVALSFVNAVEQMLSSQALLEPLVIAEGEVGFPGIRGIRSRLRLSSREQRVEDRGPQ